MTRIWHPSPLIQASVGLHAAAALGTLALPDQWPGALAAVIANHAVLGVAGMLPRSTLLGPCLTRLPPASQVRGELALTIDDGPDPLVTPQVLDMLDAAGVKASFFCIGRRARAHANLCREIVARGHRVENHGDSHSYAFALFGPKRIRSDVRAAQETLSDITGQAPLFFRPTAGLRNPFLEPVLAELGLHLAAWTRRPYDTREARPERVLQRLVHQLGAGDILLMHDGHCALTSDGQPIILATLPTLLSTVASHSLRPVTLRHAFL